MLATYKCNELVCPYRTMYCVTELVRIIYIEGIQIRGSSFNVAVMSFIKNTPILTIHGVDGP